MLFNSFEFLMFLSVEYASPKSPPEGKDLKGERIAMQKMEKYIQMIRNNQRSHYDLDYLNEDIYPLIRYVESVVDGDIILLYDYIERMIFAQYDISFIEGYTLNWISDAGRDAECAMDCQKFEKKST